MNTENYKKVFNSQKLSEEINKNSKDTERKSSVIEEFATSKPELISELYARLNNKKRVAEIFNIIENIDGQKNVEYLLQAIDRKSKNAKIFNILKLTSSIAAAVLAISFVVWTFLDKDNINPLAINEIEHNSSLNPTLKLSSGEIYELITNANKATEKSVNYIVDQSSKMKIQDLQENIYSDSTIKSKDILYLEFSVPKKSNYTVVLSDGSEVILNANSRITYPEKFSADKREVKIEGEAFFNVKKSDIPFIVNTGSSYVKVYGTTFNINARDENKVKTTLVDGIVGVGSAYIKEQILKPNQMAVVNTLHGECLITDVNATNSTGWIQGSIICLDNNLEILINDLESWYGVDIKYEEHKDIIRNTKINILIKHVMEIDAALKLIEKVVDVKFINEGGYYSIEIE